MIEKQDIRGAVRGNVFWLGVVSFLNDLSSEMIYPLLPVFFTGLVPISMAAVYIGLMDGLADSVSSILKLYAGRLSDSLGVRKPLALAGYGISSITRPLMAMAGAGWQVIIFRFMDRVGKGIRTSPRDALISESTDEGSMGVAFSFHRMMDHAGAVAGPLAAAAFLYALLGSALLWARGNGAAGVEEMRALRWLFALAILPALGGVAVLWKAVREPEVSGIPEGRVKVVEVSGRSRSSLSPRFYLFLAAVTLFALGNSSDLFLVLFAKERFGLGMGYVIALWVTLHISKTAFSLPGGSLSDRLGRRPAITSGWVVYIVVYLAMPWAGKLETMWALFILYGLYYGLTEGAERAFIPDFVPPSSRGRAYGLYHAAVGLAALPASLVFGVLWATLGARTAFLIGAGLAAAAAMLLATLRPENPLRHCPENLPTLH